MANLNAEDVNLRDELNRTLLHVNVYENRLPIVKSLLKKGADASLTSGSGITPLHVAATQKYHGIVEVLLKYSSRDKLKKFINAKVTETGNSALHIAASNGCIRSVTHLLSHGANFEVRNNAGKRPIDVAGDGEVKKLLVNVEMDSKLAAQGRYSMLQMRMFQYSEAVLAATVRARNSQGLTSLQLAVVNNHCNTVHAISEMRADRYPRNHALTDAAAIDQLVDHGKKVSEHQASLMLHSQDVNMIGGESMADEIAEILAAAHNVVKVAEKAFKPADDEPYEQPSLLAVVEETLEALQFKPGHVTHNKNGKIVFRGHKARYYKMLYIYEGDDDDDDYDFEEHEDKIVTYMGTLQIAITRAVAVFMQNIFTVKLGHSARINDLAMFEKCVEEQFVDVNVVDVERDRRTPLHHAADNGNEKMVSLLLARRADIDCETKPNEETALHLASAKGHTQVIRLLLDSLKGEGRNRFVELKTKKEGWTALHLATQAGHLDTMLCLMEYRATYDSRDKHGKTPKESSKHVFAKSFLAVIEELFAMANAGDAKLLQRLGNLQRHELLAAGNARNSGGRTIEKVAEMRGHRGIASTISKMVREATPAPPTEEKGQGFDEAFYEIEKYQLMETLAKSPT